MNRLKKSKPCLLGRLIINADDFGLSPGVNRGIQFLFELGRLTSTTLLVNMAWSNEAIKYVRAQRGMSVGVHLNLTTGQPIKPPEEVPSLVDSNSDFYDAYRFLARFSTGRIRLSEVEAELRTQIEVCAINRVQVTHLDSHMHFHVLPSLRQIVLQLARQFDIRFVRNSNLSAVVVPPKAKIPFLQGSALRIGKFLLGLTKETTWKSDRTDSRQPNSPDHLLYLRWCLEQDRDPFVSLRECLEPLTGRAVELVVHPAFTDEVLPTVSTYVEGREREINLLTSDLFMQILDDLQFSLAEPSDIAS